MAKPGNKNECGNASAGHQYYLLSRDQQDLMLCLFQTLLGTRDLDLVAGVVGSWDLDLGGSLEL